MLKVTDILAITAPNRFHSEHFARLGRFSACGTSREDAIDNLKAIIDRDSDEYMKRTYRVSAKRTTMFVLYWNGYGWQYDIMPADRTMPSSVGLSPDYSYEDAIIAMESHVRQYEG